MNTFRTISSALFATTLAASPAAAVVKVATYTGTIMNGYDQTGEFGVSDTDLTGKAFVATYVYDTDLGQRTVTSDSDAIEGGTWFGTLVDSPITSTTTPIIDATIEIGGAVRTIDANYDGEAAVEQNDQTVEDAYDKRSAESYAIFNVLEFSGVYPAVPSSLDTNFTAVPAYLDPPDFPFGAGDLQMFTVDTATGVAAHYAYATFGPATFVVSDVPVVPIPEPATWMLMIIGLATTGLATRRRRLIRSDAPNSACPAPSTLPRTDDRAEPPMRRRPRCRRRATRWSERLSPSKMAQASHHPAVPGRLERIPSILRLATITAMLLSTAFAASPAAAAVKIATYTGTIESGYDQTGEIGAPNTDLANTTYVATYVYDTSLGQRLTTNDSDGVDGGSSINSPTPIVRATIEIGGFIRPVFASYAGFASVGGGTETLEGADDDDTVGSFEIDNTIVNEDIYTVVPKSLDSSFISGPAAPFMPGFDYGYFGIATIDTTTGLAAHYAYANFGPATLVVSDAPEPATWALLIGGIATVGAAIRRRSAKPDRPGAAGRSKASRPRSISELRGPTFCTPAAIPNRAR